MVDVETKARLEEAISLIENTAQNQQTEDTVPTNEWSCIETAARDLRQDIEELKTPEEHAEEQDADGEETSCEQCGKTLDFKAKTGDPKHVYNLPTEQGHKRACKECFNEGMRQKNEC